MTPAAKTITTYERYTIRVARPGRLGLKIATDPPLPSSPTPPTSTPPASTNAAPPPIAIDATSPPQDDAASAVGGSSSGGGQTQPTAGPEPNKAPAAPAPQKKRRRQQHCGPRKVVVQDSSPAIVAAAEITDWKRDCLLDRGGAGGGSEAIDAAASSADAHDAEANAAANADASFADANAAADASNDDDGGGRAEGRRQTSLVARPDPTGPTFRSLDATIDAASAAGIIDCRGAGELNRDIVKCVLVGAIAAGDSVESVRMHNNNKIGGGMPYKDRTAGRRRYFDSSAPSSDPTELLMEVLRDGRNYPLDVTFCRKRESAAGPPPATTETAAATTDRRKRSHPVESFDVSGPAKRRRTGNGIGGAGGDVATASAKDEVICLLDSSDEEDGREDDGGEEEKKDAAGTDAENIAASSNLPPVADAATTAAASQADDCVFVAQVAQEAHDGDGSHDHSSSDDNDVVMLQPSAACSPDSPRMPPLVSFPVASPDPRAAFYTDDFVLTPHGPGKVLSSRVDRHADGGGGGPDGRSCCSCLLSPIVMYAVDLGYGVAHVPSTDVRCIEGTEFTESRVLTYAGVSLTKMDKLRLWPLTYLNDSLVNFYLKYLVKELIPGLARGRDGNSGGPSAAPLDVDDVHVFPTYFYSRISYLENGGTAYRDTKAARKRLYGEVKRWTKGFDIFSKRFLFFPINYDLHWTFVLAANPGHVLKVVPPPPPAPKANSTAQGEVGAVATTNGCDSKKDIVQGGKVNVLPEPPSPSPPPSSPSSSRCNPVGPLQNCAAARVWNAEQSNSEGPKDDNGKEIGVYIQEHMADTSMDEEEPASDMGGEPNAPVTDSGFTAVHPVVSPSDAPSTSTESNLVGASGTGKVASAADDLITLPARKEGATSIPIDVDAEDKMPDVELAPCLLHFDSGKHFKLHRSATIFKHIRKYLAACYEATKSDEFPQCVINAKTMPGLAPQVPQQDNAKDCGVYMLEIIERVLSDPPEVNSNFVAKKGNCGESPFKRTWFGKDVTDQKRLQMLSLIDHLKMKASEPVLV